MFHKDWANSIFLIDYVYIVCFALLSFCIFIIMSMRYPSIIGPSHAKRVFGYMRTAQISLRIRAVWSGPSLSANRIIGHYKMYQRRANARMRLCAYVGWIWICVLCACSKTQFLLGTAHMCNMVRLNHTMSVWMKQMQRRYLRRAKFIQYGPRHIFEHTQTSQIQIHIAHA